MKIENNILVSIEPADIINGVFRNDEVTEIGDGCFFSMKNLKEVYLTKVTTAGNNCFWYNDKLTTISLPALTTAGNYCFRDNYKLTTLSLPALTTAGNNCFSYNDKLTTISLPALTTAGNYCFRDNYKLTTLSLPALTTVGNYCFWYNHKLTTISLPALTTAGNYCFRDNYKLTTLSLPALTTAGNDCFRDNYKLTTLSLPALTTAGNDCFLSKQALTTLNINKHKYNIKTVDGYCYIIQSKKQRNDITIYSGGNYLKITDGIIQTEPCYVAEKNNYTAHGKTIKQAVTDLQLKFMSEKLKKEPINADTIITVEYYRIITGACQTGIEFWLKENNIKKKSYTAAQLLPILEDTQAYGVEMFKKLCTF